MSPIPDDASVLVREAFMLADAADYLTEHRGVRPTSSSHAHTADRRGARGRSEVGPRIPRARDPPGVRRASEMRSPRACEADVDAAMARCAVIDLDPTYDDAYNDLAFLLQERGEREREAGHDPRKILAEAVAIAERGIAVSPRCRGAQGRPRFALASARRLRSRARRGSAGLAR